MILLLIYPMALDPGNYEFDAIIALVIVSDIGACRNGVFSLILYVFRFHCVAQASTLQNWAEK